MPINKLRSLCRFVLGLFFVATGVLHFVAPGFLLRMMPPYVPFPMTAIYLSGVLECLLGAAFILQIKPRIAGWIATVLLLAVFPANIHMAMYPDLFPEVSHTIALVRLPLQFIMIAFVLWACEEPLSR